MLGTREPSLYGTVTLAEIESLCQRKADAAGISVISFQSNSEGELVSRIQEARAQASGIIINAGAYSHTSVAILDALTLTELPVIEVHLSNVFRREPFRHHSYVSQAALGVICGFGADGYLMALDAMVRHLKSSKA